MADALSTEMKMADTDKSKTDAEKAKADLIAAQTKALDAQTKADEAKKSDEQKAADKAKVEADDARAKADDAAAKAAKPFSVSTAAEAKIMAPIPADMPADAHKAQKFGNDPANPKPLPGTTDDDGKTVELYRITPDSPDRVMIKVHPDMTGNYLRAGWSKD